jgi:hypothetical protein
MAAAATVAAVVVRTRTTRRVAAGGSRCALCIGGYRGGAYYAHGGYYGRGGYYGGYYGGRGGWYGGRFYGPGFGWFLPVLPAFYATYWFGGIPYYYANDTYYTWSPDYSGYVATSPPRAPPLIQASLLSLPMVRLRRPRRTDLQLSEERSNG